MYMEGRVNPLGLPEGKYSKKKRLILDLSATHDTDDISSIKGKLRKFFLFLYVFPDV